MDNFTLLQYNLIIYSLSDQDLYIKVDTQGENVPVSVSRLPVELKRELSDQAGVRSKTKEVLTLNNNEKGFKMLFTPIQPTIWPTWFIGEHSRRNSGKKIESLILIHFTTDNVTMSLFYFPCYIVAADQHQSFAAKAIPVILKTHFLPQLPK